MKNQLSLGAGLLFLTAGVAMGVACSSTSSNPMPTAGTGATSPVGPASSSTGTGSPTASASSGGGGMGGTTTSSTTTTGAGAGPTCYDGGSPQTTDDFLNPCEPSATCQTYPNSTLPGLSADGGLPPLGP